MILSIVASWDILYTLSALIWIFEDLYGLKSELVIEITAV